MIFDHFNNRVADMKNPSILGLDTHLGVLPEELLRRLDRGNPLESATELMLEFNKRILEALVTVVPCVKVQIAFYEQYGWQGYRCYQDTLSYAKQLGYLTVADAKRNDIGSTAEAYATAFLGETELGKKGEGEDSSSEMRCAVHDADMLTVNGYLGWDGIEPFIKECKERGKGIFVLVKTSNRESGEFQDKPMEGGDTVYAFMADLVQGWGKGTCGKTGYQAIGAVVGANFPYEGEALRNRVPAVPFLVPGYGAQGAKAEDVARMFDKDGFGAYVNASRSIMTAYRNSKKTYPDAALDAAFAMREDILSALGNVGRRSY